jgi:hypothetical protein
MTRLGRGHARGIIKLHPVSSLVLCFVERPIDRLQSDVGVHRRPSNGVDANTHRDGDCRLAKC